MQLAFYQGRSFVSRLIKWATWGKYSHVAVILDDGRILEAWHKPNGVRWIKHLGEGHQAGTLVDIYDVPPLFAPVTREAERMIGMRYDFAGILGFVFRRRMQSRSKLFCSEAAATLAAMGGVILIRGVKPWKISPSLLATSVLLKPYGRAITGKTRTTIYPFPASVSQNDSITQCEVATVSPSANTADAGETLGEAKQIAMLTAAGFAGWPTCESFICADTGRCQKLDCCPKKEATKADAGESSCKCRKCLTSRGAIKTFSMTGHDLTTMAAGNEFVGMIVCETCGNKRCPHATDHLNKCTGSNAAGQRGSVYA